MRAIVVVALSLMSSSAWALSCPAPGFKALSVEDGDLFPQDGELVAFHDMDGSSRLDEEAFALLHDGAPVPHTVEHFARAAVRIVPDAPLVVGETYTLDGRSFTVVEPSEEAPLSAPAVLDTDEHGPPIGVSGAEGVRYLSVDSSFDLAARWVEFELSATGDFTDGVLVASADSQISIGHLACGTTWAEYDRQERYTVRARLVDVAGNRSDWSDAERVAGGCSVAGGGASAFGALWGLGLLGLRRRR